MDSESSLPKWLEDAKQQIASRPHVVVSEDGGRLSEQGDVRLAESLTETGVERRLVYVHRVQPVCDTAEVVLLSNEVEFASDTDIVVPARESGLPFGLMIETLLRAPVWISQIGRRIGRLDEGLRKQVSRAMDGDVDSLPTNRRGLPIKGRQDPRLEFKREELAALQTIASACVNSIIEGLHQPRLLLDPVYFIRHKGEADLDWIERLQRMAEIVLSERAEVPRLALEGFHDDIQQTCERLKEEFGYDVWSTVSPLMTAMLGDDRDLGVTEISPPRTAEVPGFERELEICIAAFAESGERVIRLRTPREAWAQSPESQIATAIAHIRGGGRMTIECQFLEAVA